MPRGGGRAGTYTADMSGETLPRRDWVGVFAAVVALAVVAAAILVPGVYVVGSVMAGALQHGASELVPGAASGRLLAASLGWASLVGFVATALGWPCAFAASRFRSATGVLVLIGPLLLPTYLAYAGWGLVRAPGTILGSWLAAAPGPSPGFWPLLASRVQAVGGLALWAWPIAAIVLSLGIRRIDRSVFESMSMEPMPRARRWMSCAKMLRMDVMAAWASVTLIMLGSAVPMHLAQMQTHSMSTWLALAESPASGRWAIWGRAWPIVVLVVVGGVLWARTTLHRPTIDADAGPARVSRLPVVLVLLAGVAAPAALFAWSIEHPRALWLFWRANGAAIVQSGVNAAIVGLLGASVCLVLWWMLDSGRRARTTAGGIVHLLVVSALVPGVIVGTAVASTWRAAPMPEALADSPAPVTAAHLARLGIVAGLMALWFSRTEAAEQHDARRIDGADTLPAWIRAGGAVRWLGLGVCAAIMGVLSLHEIEATVFVLPPGTRNLAYQMLQLLHQGRDDSLAAGVLLLLGIAAIPAGLLSALLIVKERLACNEPEGASPI